MSNELSRGVSEKGLRIFKEGKIKKEIETDRRTHFQVSGETEEHMVIFDKMKNKFSCDCRYFALRQKECSHIFAAKLFSQKTNQPTE